MFNRTAFMLLILTAAALAAEPSISSDRLSVTLNDADGTLRVRDRQSGREWSQRASSQDAKVLAAAVEGGVINLQLQPAGGQAIKGSIRIVGNELLITLNGETDLPRPLAWPHPFVTPKGTYLVVPMNEGISYPVDDTSIGNLRLIAYGGHGICMAFFGATDGKSGYMGILETADDAAISIRRENTLLCIRPEWESQKGKLGYERRIRYVFFDTGGHVAMAKRYRAYAKEAGLLKTFTEKRKERPAIDQLIGAVNIWCWEGNPVSIVKELKAAGIDRILWSNRARPDAIEAMNGMGVLTSRYDIYQDVMDPAKFPLLRGVHGDWPTAAWPKDLMIGRNGDWLRGWEVKGKDEKLHPCGIVCDKQAIAYADQRIGEELKTHPYRSRFIDTTTASPWRECYHADHPMTHTESRQYKMRLLELVGAKYKLVVGCETGHDAAVPHVDFLEGMLSLGPYRVPDSGRDMLRIWDQVPERVMKFQVGHAYRLPLWELVYHDCIVAQWYWGDYNNKLPAIWARRDLFNILYGTPPMFMFNRDGWAKNKERFAASYKAIAPVARATGYAEMTDHRFLTADRSVQQTAFANGITVTVNFGDRPHTMADGTTLAGGGHRVSGAGE